jgi:membrane protein YqaA with SNARE-associated domain
MEQQYIDILVEAFGSKTAWAFTSNIRYYALLAFESGDARLATIMAAMGCFLGSAFNYGAGRLLSILQFNGVSTIKQSLYEKWQGIFTYAMVFIGLFAWIHLVGVLILAAGFLRVRAWLALPAIFIGHALYFTYVYAEHTGQLTAF